MLQKLVRRVFFTNKPQTRKPPFLSPEDIATDIINNLSPAGKLSWMEVAEADLVTGHHGIGRHIRNHYKLWHPENPYTDIDNAEGLTFPDQVSMAIMHDVWSRLQRTEEAKRVMKTTIPAKLNLNTVIPAFRARAN